MTNDDYIHILTALLGASGAVIGVLAMLLWRDAKKQIEGKADKSEVQQLRQDLKDRWDSQDRIASEDRKRMEAMDLANRTRLDAILDGLSKRRER